MFVLSNVQMRFHLNHSTCKWLSIHMFMQIFIFHIKITEWKKYLHPVKRWKYEMCVEAVTASHQTNIFRSLLMMSSCCSLFFFYHLIEPAWKISATAWEGESSALCFGSLIYSSSVAKTLETLLM